MTGSPALMVIRAGAMTTVQDDGRYGFQDLGVPVSGAADGEALRLGNALVGNPRNLAGLEIRLSGPVLRVAANRVHLALAGTADFGIRRHSDPQVTLPAEPWRSHLLEDGDEVVIGSVREGAVAYLAVEGGFALPAVLGSLATYGRSAIGGLEGRPLRVGDRLPLVCDDALGSGNRILPTDPRGDEPGGAIRVIPGPQDDHFLPTAWEALLGAEYVVSGNADRMGLRLDGPALRHDPGFGSDIVSDGLATGCIQVPGNGQPIILLCDRQTVGGYPKIATVASVDLPRLGRLLPGARLRFAVVTVAEAERLRRQREAFLSGLVSGIAEAAAPGEIDLEALYAFNLISGIIDAFEPVPPRHDEGP
ncbi:MAG: 5-oxoprolinase/urea amidolyase family protein [Azospirillum sp.]|nr:5-oxoprolinase/urea amidolyase family protein [Azospirillum sp.]